MNQEITMLRGRLAVIEETITTLESGIDVDITDIRLMCDRNIPKSELNHSRIKTVSDRLCVEIAKYHELAAKKVQIKEDLGIA